MTHPLPDNTRVNPLLHAALTYARLGWSVFPLHDTTSGACSCRKGDCTSPGKHPRTANGFKDAITDPAVITAWWTETPNANVGIATGLSNIFVPDVDTKAYVDKDGIERHKVGAETLRALFEEYGEFPETYTVQTWSGGWHYYFQMPEPRLKNSTGTDRAGLGPDVDTRGDGGYVVAAPSVVEENGVRGQYRVTARVKPAELPAWVADKLKPRARFVAPGRGSAPPGEPYTPPVDPETGEILEERLPRPQGLDAYVQRKLQEIRALPPASAGKGSPATQPLNNMAWHLRHFATHYYSIEELREMLRAAVDETWVDGHEEAYDGIDQGLKNGEAPPRIWEERRTPGTRTWDDFGNADRLVDRHEDALRWLTDTEQWAAYVNGRWVLKGALSAVWSRCVETIRAMGDGEADLYPEDRRDGFLSFARKSRSRVAVAAMRDIAQADPRIQAAMDAFDRQRYLLNLRDGVYDLEAGELLPHSPELYLMQQARVMYDAAATAPRWERFLAQTQPEQARRDYLARVVGYTLTADTSEQCIFVHVGTGANGKSVFLDVVMALMGEYAQSVPSSTLLASKSEGVPNDVARMVGKRLLSTVETSAGKKLDEELVKQLTGGDTISARFMRAEFFDFKPVGKIHLATNHLPHVGSGYGTARRLQDIGWDVTIPEEERDRSLAERIIEEELPGVLNWALRGYQDWRLQGLSVPEAVRERTAEHVASSDTIGMWLEENTVPAPPDREIETTELFRNYSAWARAMELKPMTVMSFSNALKEHGIRKERSKQPHRRSVFFGLSIQKVVTPPPW